MTQQSPGGWDRTQQFLREKLYPVGPAPEPCVFDVPDVAEFGLGDSGRGARVSIHARVRVDIMTLPGRREGEMSVRDITYSDESGQYTSENTDVWPAHIPGDKARLDFHRGLRADIRARFRGKQIKPSMLASVNKELTATARAAVAERETRAAQIVVEKREAREAIKALRGEKPGEKPGGEKK